MDVDLVVDGPRIDGEQTLQLLWRGLCAGGGGFLHSDDGVREHSNDVDSMAQVPPRFPGRSVDSVGATRRATTTGAVLAQQTPLGVQDAAGNRERRLVE